MRALFQNRAVLIVGALVLLGGGAFVSMKIASNLNAPDKGRKAAKGGERMGRMYVAENDIPAGSVIKTRMLEEQSVPLTEIPRGAIIYAPSVNGYVTRTAIEAGSPVMKSHLWGHVDRVGFAARIPAGRRAMVVPIKPEPSLHHMLRPGDHLDLTMTLDNEYAETVLTDIEVLAVDHDPSGKPEVDTEGLDEDLQSVTLAVTPQETEVLALVINGADDVIYTLHTEVELPVEEVEEEDEPAAGQATAATEETAGSG